MQQKLTFRLTLCLILCCACDSLNLKVSKYTAVGYHEKIGIPLAKEVRRDELMNLMSRIVGGSPVTALGIIPHQVGILVTLVTGWTSLCGGALVSSTKVLTAAHCWWDGWTQARLFTAVLGSLTIYTGGTRIDTTDVTMHPNWNINTLTHDIAMVGIQGVAFTNNIQSIPLPTMADINWDFSGMSAIISGYGMTSGAQTNFPITTALHQTTVTIITNTVCQGSFEIAIHGSHLCTSGTGGLGTCHGDSGGPLTAILNTQRILVGLVSFGLNPCEAGLPSVYTRVTAFIGWIEANM